MAHSVKAEDGFWNAEVGPGVVLLPQNYAAASDAEVGKKAIRGEGVLAIIKLNLLNPQLKNTDL